MSARLLSNRNRFLSAARRDPVGRPPLWLMRQAGRCLPEYRALKEKHSFVQMVRTPDLAVEVTLQPIRRFGFDAAVLFSDILVVPEAMGQAYRFRDEGGIEMDFALRSPADLDRLQTEAVIDRLQYVTQALRLLRQELGENTALLGFAGSPWTLATYMIEGCSAHNPNAAMAMFRQHPELFSRLMEKLTHAVADFLVAQIEAGADAVQIFDSGGGLLAPEEFEAGSARWIRQIIGRLARRAPVILYSKARGAQVDPLGADVLSVDWTHSLPEVRKRLPHIAVQGNLDPALLTGAPETVRAETLQLLQKMKGLHGHIFNLGHGVPPTAKLQCIQALVDTVHSYT